MQDDNGDMPKPETALATIAKRIKKLFHRRPRLYKDEPCLLIDFDGEVYRTTLRTHIDGTLAIREPLRTRTWLEVYPDGTCQPRSYHAKWKRLRAP